VAGPPQGPPAARGRRLITFRVVLFVVLLAPSVRAFFAVRWYDTNAYYVQVSNNELMIYHGRIGGGLLYKPVVVERTRVTRRTSAVHDLPAPVGCAGGLAQGRQAYVANLVATQRQTVCTQNRTPAVPGSPVRRPRHDHDDGGTLMERRIRWLGIVMVLCFLGLFVQLNNIQIVKAHALSTSSKNPGSWKWNATTRVRHPVATASSWPARSRRTGIQVPADLQPYTAVLFSQIVGFDSIIYGKTGIEAEYNSYLESHTGRPRRWATC